MRRWAYHTLSHEIGHNLGLSHAAVDDDSAADSVAREADQSSDTSSPYLASDPLTIMGSGARANHPLNAAAKALLGWIPPSDILLVPHVVPGGTGRAEQHVRLYPFDDPASSRGLRLIQIETIDALR